MRITVPLVPTGTQSQAIQLSPSKLINLYQSPSYNVQNSKSSASLFKTPGTELWKTVPNKGTIRGWINIKDVLYLVCGNTVYVTSVSSGFLTLGTIKTSSGRVSMISDDVSIMIDDGYNGYYIPLNTGTINQVTDPSFTSSGYLTYQAGRSIFAVPNTNTFYCSNLQNLYTFNALAYAQAEQLPTQIIVAPFAMSNGVDLFIFGTYLTEAWMLSAVVVNQATGTLSSLPYTKRVGINIPYGCGSKYTIQELNGSCIFLGKNKDGKYLILNISSQYNVTSLLDENSNYQLNQLTDLVNSYARVIQINGHMFYALTSPGDNVTLLLDLGTNNICYWSSWYETGVLNDGSINYILGRHLMYDYIMLGSKSLIADYRGNGSILELNTSFNTDYNCGVDNSIYYECTAPIITQTKERFTINDIWLDMGTGFSSIDDINSSISNNLPLMSVSLSKDGGVTYPYPRQINTGTQGNYKTQAHLKLWGLVNRDGAIKFYGNHPQFIAIFNLLVDLTLPTYTQTLSNAHEQ